MVTSRHGDVQTCTLLPTLTGTGGGKDIPLFKGVLGIGGQSPIAGHPPYNGACHCDLGPVEWQRSAYDLFDFFGPPSADAQCRLIFSIDASVGAGQRIAKQWQWAIVTGPCRTDLFSYPLPLRTLVLSHAFPGPALRDWLSRQ